MQVPFSLPQHHFRHLNRRGIQRIDLRIPVSSVYLALCPDALFHLGPALLIVAGTAHGEVRQNLIHAFDVEAIAVDPQQHIQIIEDRFISVELLLIDPAARELGGMIPGPGGHEFRIGGFFHKGVISVVHPDIGVGHIVVRTLIQRLHGLQGNQLIPVIRVNDADEITGGFADALVHAVVDSVVRFRGYCIPDSPLCKRLLVGPADADRAIRRAAVDDVILQRRQGLVQNRFDGPGDGGLTLVDRGYNAECNSTVAIVCHSFKLNSIHLTSILSENFCMFRTCCIRHFRIPKPRWRLKQLRFLHLSCLLLREALGALFQQQDFHSLEDDLQIQQYAEVGDVDHIELQLVQCGRVVLAVYLRHAGKACLDLGPEGEFRDVCRVLLHVLDALGPRTYDGHLAADDVHELRQLIDAAGPNDAADSRDAVVLLSCRVRLAVLLRILDHGAELQNGEALSADGTALLAVEHRSAVLELDGCCCHGEDGTQHHQSQQA